MYLLDNDPIPQCARKWNGRQVASQLSVVTYLKNSYTKPAIVMTHASRFVLRAVFLLAPIDLSLNVQYDLLHKYVPLTLITFQYTYFNASNDTMTHEHFCSQQYLARRIKRRKSVLLILLDDEINHDGGDQASNSRLAM